MVIKSFLSAVSLLSVGVAIAADKPNIIVFLVDDMGVMDTSLPLLTDKNGRPQRQPLNDWYRTPNMVKLAEQGVRFPTFFAQSVSSPTRVSIITGQNSTRHHTTNWINSKSNNRGVYGPKDWNWTGIDKDCPTLPKMIRQGGYKTILVGKAHFGSKSTFGENPLNIGFDVNIGGCGIGHPGSYYGESGFGAIKGQKDHAVPHLEKYHGKDIFLTEALTLEANMQIEKAVDERRPFFLYMAHYAAHSPFHVDKRFVDNYKGKGKNNQQIAFATIIEGMDKSLGDIINNLEKLGVADNTLILFLGDNGSDSPMGVEKGHYSSAPLRGKKGTEYEGGVRVPFIASWAKVNPSNKNQARLNIKPNSIQTQQGSVMDIYPTVLNLAGVPLAKSHIVDGYDLAAQLSGIKNSERSDKLVMHFPHEHRGYYFTTFRSGEWKLIYHYNPQTPIIPQFELYNLKIDPYENTNLATKNLKQLKIMVNDMAKELERQDAHYPLDGSGNSLKPIQL